MSRMSCVEVEKALVFYLDAEAAEITTGERRSIEEHLAGCPTCQNKLAAMAATRKSATQALQSLAAMAEPSPQAWDLLQSRLASEARPAPARKTVWNSRLAPGAGNTPRRFFHGENKMRTKIVFPALAAAVLLAVIGIFFLRNATPVSAQQILERAYQAKNAATIAQGILHQRIETYINLQVMGGKLGVEKTIQDSYVDLSSGIFRQVWMDAATGKILDASAYDGNFLYSKSYPEQGTAGGPLTLYRTPQSIDKVASLKPGGSSVDPENVFESIRQKPDVKSVTQETWSDGRKVFVLRADSPKEAGQKFQVKNFVGDTVMVFDDATYDLLENSIVMNRDGKEVVLTSYRKLVDETLPAGSPVAWNLSDLTGIKLIDDPNGEHGDLLPEVITPEELAAHTQTGYLLRNVPAGFSLEISAPPKQEQGTGYIYIAAYRTPDNDYFVIQSGDAPGKVSTLSQDTYQTTSKLTLYFMPTLKDEADKAKEYTEAFVAGPTGVQFSITSTLSRQRVEELAEELVLVK